PAAFADEQGRHQPRGIHASLLDDAADGVVAPEAARTPGVREGFHCGQAQYPSRTSSCSSSTWKSCMPAAERRWHIWSGLRPGPALWAMSQAADCPSLNVARPLTIAPARVTVSTVTLTPPKAPAGGSGSAGGAAALGSSADGSAFLGGSGSLGMTLRSST